MRACIPPRECSQSSSVMSSKTSYRSARPAWRTSGSRSAVWAVCSSVTTPSWRPAPSRATRFRGGRRPARPGPEGRSGGEGGAQRTVRPDVEDRDLMTEIAQYREVGGIELDRLADHGGRLQARRAARGGHGDRELQRGELE